MKIGIITATTFVSALPNDIQHPSYYGSEHVGAELVEYLLELTNHTVEFWAPIGSTNFSNNDRVKFHPIKNTYGQHPPDDLIESVSFEHGAQTTDLLNCDFVIDMSKFCNSIEELFYYNKFRKFVILRSGHQDYFFPFRINPPTDRHYVTHNRYFTELYGQAGYPADYVNHAIHPFWCPGDNPEYWKYFEDKGLEKKNYWLFAHRPATVKGIERVLELASVFPNDVFCISTSAPLPDHQQTLNEVLRQAQSKQLTNIKYIPCPTRPAYHHYRREIMRNAKGSLCIYLTDGSYVDNIGYIGLESLACGAPLIATKSAGSLDILGDDAHKKSVLFIDGIESCKYAVEHFSSYDLKGELPLGWTKEDTVNKYMELFKKYA